MTASTGGSAAEHERSPCGQDGPTRVVVVSHGAGDELASQLSAVAGPEWVRCGPGDASDALAAASDADPGGPVALVGIGACAGAALHAGSRDSRTAAVCLIGGRLDEDAIELVEHWPELPLLSVADPLHRPGLRSMTDAHLASANAASDLRIGALDTVALEAVARWLVDRSARTATIEDVTFESEDGWLLHATRSMPATDRRVPGVVLLHSGRSDRGAYARLERLLVDAGLAVLNVDWRGRGQSTNLGSYFDLDPAVKAAGWRDARAALDHLGEYGGVDASRLAAVGVVHGAEYAVRAAHRDPRVRAVVILTGYRPDEPEERPHLVGGAVEVLYVTSTEHRITTDAMRSLYEESTGTMTQFVEYPGGAIGYQLFELDPTLEPRIVTWLGDALAVAGG